MADPLSDFPPPAPPPPVRPRRPLRSRIGWGIALAISLFLLSDGVLRIIGFTPYVEGLVRMGFPEGTAVAIGFSLVLSTILYLIPFTAFFGAILLTGYLGGAVAAQVRLEDPWFFFPIVFAALAWIALILRDPRVGRAIWGRRGPPPGKEPPPPAEPGFLSNP